MTSSGWWRNSKSSPKHQVVVYPWCLISVILLSPWYMAAAVGQGLGAQGEQGTHLTCGWDYTRSDTLQSMWHTKLLNSFSPKDSSVHPLCPSTGHALLIPMDVWVKGYTGYRTRQQHSSCSVSRDAANRNPLYSFSHLPIKKTKQNKKPQLSKQH